MSSTLRPRSVLVVLPMEVVTLIVHCVRSTDFETLCVLRRTNKAFNALVEPIAFSSILFSSDSQSRGLLHERLRMLASGKHPYSRWAQTLKIELGSLLPTVRKESGHCSVTVEDRKNLLSPAIESLRNLKRVSFAISIPQDSYEDVISALSRLPRLEELSLSHFSFHWDSNQKAPLPLQGFFNLRHIELASMRLLPSFCDAVQCMIDQSTTTLEHFELVPNMTPSDQWDSRVEDSEVKKIVLDKCTSDATLSTLKILVVDARGVQLSASSVRAFRSLVHLDVYCAAGEVDPSFWDAMAEAGVRLQTICIFPVTDSVCRYLAAYTGLKTLKVCHSLKQVAPLSAAQNGAIDVTVKNLFDILLPKHQETLEGLIFEGMKFDEFTMDRETMKRVSMCKKLENLCIGYHHPSLIEADSWNLTSLMEFIVNAFPCLEDLTMEAIAENPVHRRRLGSATRRTMRSTFWDAIRAAEAELGVGLDEGSAVDKMVVGGPTKKRVIQVMWEP